MFQQMAVMNNVWAGGWSATQPNNPIAPGATMSPHSRIRLIPDTTNNLIWNTHLWLTDLAMEDEAKLTSKLGSHRRLEVGKTSIEENQSD
jgi:hypothetical protein